MDQLTFNLAPQRRIWRVSEITARIRSLLEREFQAIWVEGEISNFREASSGHLYFTLKDEAAQIRCVCFRNQARLLKFRPQDGLAVTVRGSLSVYDQRGEYQIYVEHVEPVGLGALQLAFEQLKARLEAEGLFDPARKRPLPVLPGRIGLVTSPGGAAVRDILRVLRRRFPNAWVTIFPVKVQGEGAPAEIAAALRWFNRARAADVLIVARGGGSLEDLWAFNEEAVARAIAASEIPVITGIGHETDFTIADFVADVRAPTPSAAAEIVVRTRMEFDGHIAELQRQLRHHIRVRLLEARDRLRELARHAAFQRPAEILRQRRQEVDEAAARIGALLAARLEEARQRVAVAAARVGAFDLRARLAALSERVRHRCGELGARLARLLGEKRRRLEAVMVKLDERSPLRALERGYAVVYDAAGNIVRAADAVALGDELAIQLARGRLGVEVKRQEK